jgi:hypothetical protein
MSGKQPKKEYMQDQIKDSPMLRRVMNTCIPKDHIFTKMTLNNYDGLTDPREYVQNVQNSLELVIQGSHAMCKIIPITFRGLIRVWYNNLESDSITSSSDLYVNLVT